MRKETQHKQQAMCGISFLTEVCDDDGDDVDAV